MALVDLQLAVVTASIFSDAIRCLATSVLAGQLGALLVWGILGSGPIIWRIPSLVILLLVAWNCYEVLVRIRQNASWTQLGWNDLLNVEAVTLAALCGMLRLRGYSLHATNPDSGSGTESSSQSTSLQFGIRDVLIWTTCLALLLGIAKAGDLLKAEFVQQNYAVGFLLVATVALSTAAVLLVAIWASLGRGRFTFRLLVLVLTALAAGTPFALYSVHVGQPMMVSNRDYRFAHWYAIGYWWIGWMFLTATLLAASLIIFRTLGYRLVWVPRRASRLP
jgi:cation transport ATPase